MANEIIDALKADGLKVYMRKPTDSYAYCTDGTGIAYVQWSDRFGTSTVHIPNRQAGTGFQFSEKITPEIVREAMTTTAPGWATGRDIASVRKYKDWDSFHNGDKWHAELKEVEDNHEEPTFENQLWHANKVADEKGESALLNPSALTGKICGCGSCYCCAAYKVAKQRRWL